MSEVTGDLNQVIASAVQARIETEVATALAGSELLAQYVTAALTEKISVRDPNTYRDRETTFLRETIDKAIRGATKAAVETVIAGEAKAIEKIVATELRRQVPTIAKMLVGDMKDHVSSSHGLKVELHYPSRY